MICKKVYKKFPTFNCQGLLNKAKQMNIADNSFHHQLTAMVTQETHTQGRGIHEIMRKTTSILLCHKDKSVTGTGILVRPNLKVNCTPVSERIYA